MEPARPVRRVAGHFVFAVAVRYQSLRALMHGDESSIRVGAAVCASARGAKAKAWRQSRSPHFPTAAIFSDNSRARSKACLCLITTALSPALAPCANGAFLVPQFAKFW